MRYDRARVLLDGTPPTTSPPTSPAPRDNQSSGASDRPRRDAPHAQAVDLLVGRDREADALMSRFRPFSVSRYRR